MAIFFVKIPQEDETKVSLKSFNLSLKYLKAWEKWAVLAKSKEICIVFKTSDMRYYFLWRGMSQNWTSVFLSCHETNIQVAAHTSECNEFYSIYKEDNEDIASMWQLNRLSASVQY